MALTLPPSVPNSPSPRPLAAPIGAVVPYDMALDRELRAFSQDHHGFEQLDLLFTRTQFEPLAVTVEQAREISKPDLIAESVRSVSAPGPEGYIYACTSGSFIRGLDGERRLAEHMRRAGAEASSAADYAVQAAVPDEAYHQAAAARLDHPAHDEAAQHPSAATTSGALLDAVHALDVSRVAAATPYDDAIGALFSRFFAEAGVEVVQAANLGLSGRIWTTHWETIYSLIRQADHPDAEAVLVSCTNLPTYQILDQLEQDLGKPVISANQVTIWSTLRQIGREYCGPGESLKAVDLPPSGSADSAPDAPHAVPVTPGAGIFEGGE